MADVAAFTDDIVDGFESKFMDLALKQAEMGNAANEVPVGAVLVDEEGSIVASAHNATNATGNGMKHCEILIIEHLASQQNRHSVSNCTLYVTVEPCLMCASALKIMNIKAVFYGCANGKFGGNGSIYSLHEKDSLGFPVESKADSYSSTLKYQQSAVDLLKAFYEGGNDSISEEKRARKKRKLKK